MSFSTGLGSGLAQLPGKYPLRSRATTEVAMVYFEEMGYDLDGPIRAVARLATGKTFYSKWQTLPSKYRKPRRAHRDMKASGERDTCPDRVVTP